MLLSQEPVEHLVLAQACIGYWLSPGSIFFWEKQHRKGMRIRQLRVGAILCAEMSTSEAYQEDQWHFATCGQHIFLSLWKAPRVTISGLEDLASWKKTKNDQLKKVVVKLLFFQSVALIYSVLSPPTLVPTFMPPTTVKPWSRLVGLWHDLASCMPLPPGLHFLTGQRWFAWAVLSPQPPRTERNRKTDQLSDCCHSYLILCKAAKVSL